MTTVFAVVGEHREEPDRLLLLGDDGQHYALRLPDGAPLPLLAEPDSAWSVDVAAEDNAQDAFST